MPNSAVELPSSHADKGVATPDASVKQMDIVLDYSKKQPVTLCASTDAAKLQLNTLLTVESADIPRVGDDIKISFSDGLVAYAAVIFINAHKFPVIRMRAECFVLLPAGRTNSGARWLVMGYQP